MKEELAQRLKGIDKKLEFLNEDQAKSPVKMSKEYSWLTEDERKKWKEDWSKKAQQAEELTKKVASVQAEIKKRKKEKKKLEQEKAAEEKAKKEKEEALKKEEDEKKKEEEKKKKEEDFETKRKERKELVKLANEKVPKKTYLYQKMTQQFENDVEMPELEKRKKEIAEKRSLFQPIRLHDLKDFQQNHDANMKKSEEKRSELLTKRKKEQAIYYSQVIKKLKSVFTDEIVNKDKEVKEKDKLQEEEPQVKYSRMKDYGKLIKSSYLPVASEKKALELKEKIEKLKHHARIARSKNDILTPKVDSQSVALEEKKVKKKEKTRRNSNGKLTQSSDQIKKEENAVPKKINYLEEFKNLRPKQHVSVNFEKIANDNEMSPNQKYELITAKSKMLEETARQKEHLLSIKEDPAAKAEMAQQVSDLYISTIKAKLALLNS